MKSSLENLLSRSDVEFEGIAETGFLGDVVSRFRKASDALVPIDINVYGPRGDVATYVGRTLSRNRLYLQTPEASRSSVPYENPQKISFSGKNDGGSSSRP